jgi:hypothetical protein
LSEALLKLAGLITPDLSEEIKKRPGLAHVMVDAARAQLAERRFAQSRNQKKKNTGSPARHASRTIEVDPLIQIRALRNAFEYWEDLLPSRTIERLSAHVPLWPKGMHTYRSFRIRFGEGDEGVKFTFERHLARIRSVFGETHFWLCPAYFPHQQNEDGTPFKRHVQGSKMRKPCMEWINEGAAPLIRLTKGNKTHTPCIEWVIVDLNADPKSAKKVESASALADELLTFAWLFPNVLRKMKNPYPLGGGYEVRTPVLDDKGKVLWDNVLQLGYDQPSSMAYVTACCATEYVHAADCALYDDSAPFIVPYLV